MQAEENEMTLCPIALAVGCRRCFAFSFCPVKSLIGDQSADPKTPPKGPSSKTP